MVDGVVFCFETSEADASKYKCEKKGKEDGMTGICLTESRSR